MPGPKPPEVPLSEGERQELGPGSAAVYSLDGHLIHGNADGGQPGLWALPISLETLSATGEAFQIAEIGVIPGVSQDGTLAFRDGGEGT